MRSKTGWNGILIWFLKKCIALGEWANNYGDDRFYDWH